MVALSRFQLTRTNSSALESGASHDAGSVRRRGQREYRSYCFKGNSKWSGKKAKHYLDGVVVEMFALGVVVAAVVVALTMLCVVLEVAAGAA
jgi:hypothetical protein